MVLSVTSALIPCSVCIYADGKSIANVTLCRRYAPQAFITGATSSITGQPLPSVWPQVNPAKDACGDGVSGP